MLPKMIISADCKKMLDEAVHSELYASNLYKHIANQLQRIGYFGATKFFLKESAVSSSASWWSDCDLLERSLDR